MLVLSRKRNERILIGKDIEIVVAKIRGDRVLIGITAPPNTEIVREELKKHWQPHLSVRTNGVE